MDCDGSVIGTTRMAVGAAVGYNRKQKGQRSYYPLFCTLAQTGQVLGVWHRSGYVHDSNGARAFILVCLNDIWKILPRAILEAEFVLSGGNEILIAVQPPRNMGSPVERLTFETGGS